MKHFRTVQLLAGALIVLLGLVWIGQGTGWFPYPASSAMIAQTQWAWRGLAVVMGGVVLFVPALLRRG